MTKLDQVCCDDRIAGLELEFGIELQPGETTLSAAWSRMAAV